LGDQLADFILCLVSERAEEGYGAILSAAAAAHEYRMDLAIGVQLSAGRRLPPFARLLPAEIRHRALALPPSQFDRLGLRASSAIGVVRDGCLRHLVGRLANPHDVRHHLGFFLDPPIAAAMRDRFTSRGDVKCEG
jgi:hypothetical protein